MVRTMTKLRFNQLWNRVCYGHNKKRKQILESEGIQFISVSQWINMKRNDEKQLRTFEDYKTERKKTKKSSQKLNENTKQTQPSKLQSKVKPSKKRQLSPNAPVYDKPKQKKLKCETDNVMTINQKPQKHTHHNQCNQKQSSMLSYSQIASLQSQYNPTNSQISQNLVSSTNPFNAYQYPNELVRRIPVYSQTQTKPYFTLSNYNQMNASTINSHYFVNHNNKANYIHNHQPTTNYNQTSLTTKKHDNNKSKTKF